jgi:hypothetical protein
VSAMAPTSPIKILRMAITVSHQWTSPAQLGRAAFLRAIGYWAVAAS